MRRAQEGSGRPAGERNQGEPNMPNALTNTNYALYALAWGEGTITGGTTNFTGSLPMMTSASIAVCRPTRWITLFRSASYRWWAKFTGGSGGNSLCQRAKSATARLAAKCSKQSAPNAATFSLDFGLKTGACYQRLIGPKRKSQPWATISPSKLVNLRSTRPGLRRG